MTPSKVDQRSDENCLCFTLRVLQQMVSTTRRARILNTDSFHSIEEVTEHHLDDVRYYLQFH